jgi:large subunit ribosomal protein L7e
MVKTIKDVKAVVPMPETLLKKRRRNLKREEERAAHAQKVLKNRRKMRSEALKRAEKYAKEYKQKEAALENERLQALESGNFFVEPEAKLAFVIRIRGLKGVSPKCRKALQLLRLRQINNGVFIRINKATLNLLKLVEPYVAWGYPTLETVRELVYKRGFANVNGSRIPITSNAIIEKALRPNCICVEDLIHEIYTVGDNFKKVNNFLWPFKLRSAKGGLNSIKKHFVDGGDFGNREEYINDMVKNML